MDFRRLIICFDAYPLSFFLFADGILFEVSSRIPCGDRW